MENNSDLRKLQLLELELLKQFDIICKKYKLRYFILGGTLLGAVRHKGFIPWDDDVDVSMPRKDYEKFLKIAAKELEEGTSIVSIHNSDQYRYGFARLETDKMKIINRSANKPRVEKVWIDLIPLDGMPKNIIIKTIHKVRLSFWWNLNQIAQYDELVDQKRKRSAVSKFLVKAAGVVHRLLPVNYKMCLKKLDTALRKFSYDGEDIIINYLAAYGFKETFDKRLFGDGKDYLFEGDLFKGPDDYDGVCKIIYGDYMTLPPEDERNKHNSEIVSE